MKTLSKPVRLRKAMKVPVLPNLKDFFKQATPQLQEKK